MHGLDKTLLTGRQFDSLLVATLAFHTGRDTTDNDDSISSLHLISQRRVVHLLTLTDVTTQHREVTITTTILNNNVVVLTLLNIERLVVSATASEAEATETATTTSTRLASLDGVAVDD